MGRDRAPKQPRKEHTALQKAHKEIQMLKRQLSRLKKVISHMNMEDYQNVQEAIAAHKREREQLKKDESVIDEMSRWKCFSCEEDYLRLVIYQKIDKPYYFRRCPNCGKKTNSKQFKDNVEGPLPDEQ